MKYSYPTLSEVGDSSALILDLNQIVFLKKIVTPGSCVTLLLVFGKSCVIQICVSENS